MTLLEKARAMLREASLPLSLWGEAITTANYLRNRSPTTDRDATPWELFTNKKPDLSNLRTFGCEVYVHIPKHKRSKLDNTAVKGILVGYMPNGYWILLEDSKQVQVSLDVVFNENKPKATKGLHRSQPSRPVMQTMMMMTTYPHSAVPQKMKMMMMHPMATTEVTTTTMGVTTMTTV
jgi:hypothetical protein